MSFVMPKRTCDEAYDYHVRMDAILEHLRNDGSYEELRAAGVSDRDIDTANEIMEIRGE